MEEEKDEDSITGLMVLADVETAGVSDEAMKFSPVSSPVNGRDDDCGFHGGFSDEIYSQVSAGVRNSDTDFYSFFLFFPFSFKRD